MSLAVTIVTLPILRSVQLLGVQFKRHDRHSSFVTSTHVDSVFRTKQGGLRTKIKVYGVFKSVCFQFNWRYKQMRLTHDQVLKGKKNLCNFTTKSSRSFIQETWRCIDEQIFLHYVTKFRSITRELWLIISVSHRVLILPDSYSF
jgi:hypothetical protein